MENTNEIKNINVKLARIKELSFQSAELPDDLIAKIDEATIAYGIGVRLVPLVDSKEFGVAFLIKYTYNQGEENKDLCSYEMECVFKIIEYDQAIKYNGSQVNIEDGLLSTFISITIGTARGMLALKTTGTILNKYPLPLINPLDILQQLKDQAKQGKPCLLK